MCPQSETKCSTERETQLNMFTSSRAANTKSRKLSISLRIRVISLNKYFKILWERTNLGIPKDSIIQRECKKRIFMLVKFSFCSYLIVIETRKGQYNRRRGSDGPKAILHNYCHLHLFVRFGRSDEEGGFLEIGKLSICLDSAPQKCKVKVNCDCQTHFN